MKLKAETSWSLMAVGGLALAVFVSAGVARQSRTLSLLDALTDGLVTATFTGMGASSGDAIKVRVTRRDRTGGTLRLTIPPGAVLRSATAAIQNMVVLAVQGRDSGNGLYTPESEIVLAEGSVTYLLSALCLDFEKENPAVGSTFALQPAQDPVLACLAREGAGRSVSAAQAAVWMYIGGVNRERMNEVFPVSTTDWTAGASLLRACRRP